MVEGAEAVEEVKHVEEPSHKRSHVESCHKRRHVEEPSHKRAHGRCEGDAPQEVLAAAGRGHVSEHQEQYSGPKRARQDARNSGGNVGEGSQEPGGDTAASAVAAVRKGVPGERSQEQADEFSGKRPREERTHEVEPSDEEEQFKEKKRVKVGGEVVSPPGGAGSAAPEGLGSATDGHAGNSFFDGMWIAVQHGLVLAKVSERTRPKF